MSELLRYNYSQKYIVFDLETCNVNLAFGNLPWQISYLVAQNEKILEQKDYFIKWPDLDKKISKGAAQVTRFNPLQYKDKAKLNKEILDEFEKYLYDDSYIKIGHNLMGFDIFIHNIWRNELGLKTDYSYLNNCIDSNSLARMAKLGIKDIKKEYWKREFFKFADYREKGLKTSIKWLCKEFKLEYLEERAHDSSYDIIKNFEILNKLKYMIEI